MVKIKEFNKDGLILVKANNVASKSKACSLKSIVYLLSVILVLSSENSDGDSLQSGGIFVNAQRQRRERKDDERDITAEEVEEMADDSMIEDDPDELAKKAMMEEWDVHMADFVPNDMLSVQLNPREEIVSQTQNSFLNLFIFSLFTRIHQISQHTLEEPIL